MTKLVFLLAVIVSSFAQAQDLGSLEREIQNQIQVTQDLSQLVNRVIEKDQTEGSMKHYDYWLKKRELVARVSAALAEYEAYLVHHMDPLKPLYARYNFIHNSLEYSETQKSYLIQDVIKEVRKLVAEKIQPEKIKAYIKLLRGISPYFPVVHRIEKVDRSDVTTEYIRAGEPEKPLPYNHYFRVDFSDMLLGDFLPGCYSETCQKLYAADIYNLIKDFFEKIPSHVIINLGNHQDDSTYRDGRVMKYPKHVLSTVYPYFGDPIFSEIFKGLPYSLSEAEYLVNKEKLEKTLRESLIAYEKKISVKRLFIALLDEAVIFERGLCKKETINERAIATVIQKMCGVSTIPGGDLCLSRKEDVDLFSQAKVQELNDTATCQWDWGDREVLVRKVRAKVLEQVHKLKWPK